MVEYLDDALGRLISYLKASGLDKTTYVMIMSDNGAFLMPDEPTKVNTSVRQGGTFAFLTQDVKIYQHAHKHRSSLLGLSN